MKKNWIYLKRGLCQDPKHRQAMGDRIWLFLHMIDRANWETGVIEDWRDRIEADDMEMSWRTLQRQRQELSELGYITCAQVKDRQRITILNWINPRNYSAEVLNPKPSTQDQPAEGTQICVPPTEGTQICVPPEVGGTHEGTHEGTHMGNSGVRTPTLDSKGISQGSTTTARRAADAAAASAPRVPAEVLKVYEDNIGLATPVIVDDLEKAVSDYSADWVIEALRETARARVKRLNYALKILESWKRDGYKADRRPNANARGNGAAEPAGFDAIRQYMKNRGIDPTTLNSNGGNGHGD